MNAPALSLRSASDPRFIDLDMILQAAANAVAARTHHAGSQFVEDLERRLVNRKAELTLKLNRRDTGSIRGNQVCAPRPDRHTNPSRQRIALK